MSTRIFKQEVKNKIWTWEITNHGEFYSTRHGLETGEKQTIAETMLMDGIVLCPLVTPGFTTRYRNMGL